MRVTGQGEGGWGAGQCLGIPRAPSGQCRGRASQGQRPAGEAQASRSR